MRRLFISMLIVPIVSMAQAAMPTEFPDGASALSADMVREQFAGKSYAAQPFSGPRWRIEFNNNGYAFLDVSSGASDKGTWRAEEGKICIDWKRIASGCSEVRRHGEAIYLKRASGEVVLLSR